MNSGFQALSIALVSALVLGCPKTTGIKGVIELTAGEQGDLSSTQVQLFDNQNLAGSPVAEETTAQASATRAEFSFLDLAEGEYYLRAWKDANSNSQVDDRDLVGVPGGGYRPGYGGNPISVEPGKLVDIGVVSVAIFRQFKLQAGYVRQPSGYLDFTYRFNYDCTVDTWALVPPWTTELLDPRQHGPKKADTTYISDGWGAGTPPPGGIYRILVSGSWSQGRFRDSAKLSVPD
ncbi:MAG: hypothetical protein ABIK62_03400 [candidate division WOR-3 bacterium]